MEAARSFETSETCYPIQC